MATIKDLETLYTETLSAVEPVLASDIVAPAPVNIADVDITSTATVKTVSATAISAFSQVAPTGVVYSPVSTTDEITNESLNRTAESLKNSVNAELGAWVGTLNTSINTLRNETDGAITNLVGNVNNQLAALKAEADGQVTDINSQIDNIINDMNVQMLALRTQNLTTSADVAREINDVTGQLTLNIEAVKRIADNSQAKIAALNDVYATDGAAAERIAEVNELIATLNGADMDFVQAVDGVIDEVNSMKRTNVKEVIMNAGTGTYAFSLASEGFGEFLDVSDYEIAVEVIGNNKVEAHVVSKTVTGFSIECKSQGVHFVPQPIDGAVTPVNLSVEIKHSKRDPLTFNVDTLQTSFITDGAVTASNTVGAMALSANTLIAGIGAIVDTVTVSDAEGTLTVTSSDESIATATYDESTLVLSVTGVDAGEAVISVSDGVAVRHLTVTVA